MGQLYRVVIKNEKGEITIFNRKVNGVYELAKLTEHSWWYNDFVGSLVNIIYQRPTQVAWVGDYADADITIDNDELYNLAWIDNDGQSIHKHVLLLDNKYLVNHNKKVYLDCNKYKEKIMDKDGWCLHPLPLLTAIGNGKGGGDYYGINQNDVGSWAYEKISVEDNPPVGYTEEVYEFNENLIRIN